MSDFNFEDFISGAQLARRTVSAYKVDHSHELEALRREYDVLRKERDALVEDADEREGVASGPVSRLREVAERIEAMRDEMESSRIDFVIRTLTPDEFKRFTDDDETTVYDQFALQSVEPKLTAEQARIVAERIGAAQWGEMMQQANALILSKVAVPDFSRNDSEMKSPRRS